VASAAPIARGASAAPPIAADLSGAVGATPHRVRAAVLELQHRRVAREGAALPMLEANGIPSVNATPASSAMNPASLPIAVRPESRMVIDARPALDKGTAPRDVPVAKAPPGAARSAHGFVPDVAHAVEAQRAARALGAGSLHAALDSTIPAHPAAPQPTRAPQSAAENPARNTRASDSVTDARPASSRAADGPAPEPRPAATETLALRPNLPVDAATAARSGSAPAPSIAGTPGPLLGPPLPTAAASLVQAAVDDETLHAAAIGNSAHLRLQTASGQDVSLHIRVRDGIADIRVDGSTGTNGALPIELRASEVRTALAGEGISLGTFEARPTLTGSPGRDLATAAAIDGALARPFSSDAGALQADRNRATAGTWSSPASPSVGELRAPDSSNNSTSTGAQGYGYGHGAGTHSRSPSDSGADRDGGRGAPNPLQPPSSSSSSSTSTTSSSPPSDPRVNRGVHITA
jgi:hypothetical protein